MKKLFIGIVLAGLLIWPGASSAQALNTLSVSQLQAILASLQAQLNALIAQLNQLQQQENNSKCLGLNQEGGAGSPSCCSGLTRQNLSSSGTTYKCVKPIVKPIENIKPRISTVGSKGGSEGEIFLDSKVYVTGKNLSTFTHANISGLYGDKIETFPLSSNDGQEAIFTIKSIPVGDYKLNLINSTGSMTNSLSITVKNLSSNGNSSITITSPNGGETLKVGSNHYVQWSHTVPLCGDCTEPSVLVKIIGKAYEAKLGFIEVNDKGFNWKVGESMAGTIPLDGNPFQIETCVGLNNQNICDRSDYFTITGQETPSRAGTINVRVLKGGIYCIKAPCEFPLAGATVALYDQNKVLVGNQVVGADGFATFTGLNPGTYTAISRATGYVNTTNTIGVLAGQSVSIKTILMISPAPTSQLKASSELASVLQSLQRVLGTLSPALGH